VPAALLCLLLPLHFSAAACAGISEGLLSGCCGILNESVRRQIYIVRTSGARLLALINDVMDAAALRQHRLVLKQERLELRQLVGDVSDLTRSLVDNEVALRNEVPEGMLVWADSGRIIQVGAGVRQPATSNQQSATDAKRVFAACSPMLNCIWTAEFMFIAISAGCVCVSSRRSQAHPVVA
jgi:hypothetical protein